MPREHACPTAVSGDWADYMLVARCTTTVIAQVRLLSVLWVFRPVMMFEMAMVCVAFLWRTLSKPSYLGRPGVRERRVFTLTVDRERTVNPNHRLRCQPHPVLLALPF